LKGIKRFYRFYLIFSTMLIFTMSMLAWNISVNPSPRLPFMAGAAAVLRCSIAASQGEPLNLGNQRGLFCDRHPIETLHGAQLMLHKPKDEGAVLPFDQPWEDLSPATAP
jgi:hypothetical protein